MLRGERGQACSQMRDFVIIDAVRGTRIDALGHCGPHTGEDRRRLLYARQWNMRIMVRAAEENARTFQRAWIFTRRSRRADGAAFDPAG